MTKISLFTLTFLTILSVKAQDFKYFSPSAIEIDKNLETLIVAGKTAKEVRMYKLDDFSHFKTLKTKLNPTAIALGDKEILITTTFSEGKLLLVNKKSFKQKESINVGHGAVDVIANKDFSKAYVANQFSNDISVVNLKTKRETKRIPVLRQPTQLEISKNGKYLFVANFLTAGRADVDTVTAEISIIDLDKEELIKNIPLANGSNALRGMAQSVDGKYIFISHNLGRFQVPTTQLEQGWMNTSAMSIIDASSLKYVATILLDEPENGAAGSWGIDCTSEYILVAHSGTHDFSVIDYPKFIEKLMLTEDKASLSYDLRFLSGIRKRVKSSGNGPRVLKAYNEQVFVANYFSDFIDVVDLNNPVPANYKQLVLNDKLVIDEVRLGEIYFNDASYCFQHWQSCNGCHPGDARTDGLNWDLMNDQMGNPKNCKSMLGAHKTPPAMISGIRPDAETAVRAGFKYIQFAKIEEEHAEAVDEYLKSLKPVPSPLLVDGQLSAKAKKGKQVFEEVGCVHCHKGPWLTDQKIHEIGKQGEYDHQNKWDTPTLIEVWRTGPYLHDGRAATLKDVFAREKHGLRKELSEEEIDILVEYVMSL